MAKTWVLDTETKGTGANMVPLEKVERRPERSTKPRRSSPERRGPAPRPAGSDDRTQRPRPARAGSKQSSPLAPGHVRKKATGEIGQIRSVDPKAGTAIVHWLKRGATSTVPLSAISRR